MRCSAGGKIGGHDPELVLNRIGTIAETHIAGPGLEIMKHATGYRRWMFEQVGEYGGRRILEVGGGIGNFTEFLLDSELVLAVDLLAACVEHVVERFSPLKHIIPMQFDVQEHSILQLEEMNFDTVVCLNVLEHLEDDTHALRNMNQLLRPAGRLVLLVPAFQFLYGTVDRSLNHFRRYLRKGPFRSCSARISK